MSQRAYTAEKKHHVLVDPSRLYTADEVLALPGGSGQWHELERGRLIIHESPGAEHGSITMTLGAHLLIFAEEHGLGRTFAAETGFLIETNPDTVRGPDVGFVRTERLPVGGLPAKHFPGAPDLAVEVVSPSDRRSAVLAKVRRWLDAGTRLVWLVEPRQRRVRVFRPDGSESLLGIGDRLDGEDVVPGFEFLIERLFE